MSIVFEPEDIPDDHDLFMRVHKQYTTKGILLPTAFRSQGDGMSTDWNKYSTPVETKARANKNPENNGVISFSVGATRKIPEQIVKHTPEDNNRAHTDVFGIKKDPKIRIAFKRISKWEINPPI